MTDVVTADELRSECSTLLLAFTGEGGDRAKAEAHAPGGPENPDTTARGWLRYYQQLHRMHAVVVGHGREHAPRSAGAVEAAIDASLGDRGVGVQCSDGVERFVRPKSYHALAFLTALDRMHTLEAEAAAASAELLTGEDLKVFALSPMEASFARRLWLWILTSSGPELPFDDEGPTPKPPKWTKSATPEDVLAIFEAHVEVHQRRLAIIAQAFPSEGGGQTRLPLSGFIGAVAAESGRDARDLMRRHSLGKLFAESITAAETAREARRRAESKAS